MAVEVIVGRHAVLEALRSGRHVHRLLMLAGKRSPAQEEALSIARTRDIGIHMVSRVVLDKLSEHHQGMAAEIAAFPYVEVEDLLARTTSGPVLLVALDSVQDPQNFGTLLRTAAAVGSGGAIIPRHRAAGVTPAVERASAGAVSKLGVAQVTNLVRALDQVRAAGVWVFGIDAHAAERYDQVDLTGPLALVVGSEGSGLGRLVREHCDKLIRVPMVAGFDSLNVAVAGSIVLAEVFRQREKSGEVKEGALSNPVTAGRSPGARNSVASSRVELDSAAEARRTGADFDIASHAAEPSGGATRTPDKYSTSGKRPGAFESGRAGRSGQRTGKPRPPKPGPRGAPR